MQNIVAAVDLFISISDTSHASHALAQAIVVAVLDAVGTPNAQNISASLKEQVKNDNQEISTGDVTVSVVE